jgi:hypothetical protein
MYKVELRERIIIGSGREEDPARYLRDNPLVVPYELTNGEGSVDVTIMGYHPDPLQGGNVWTRGRYGWGFEGWCQQHRETPNMPQDERLYEAFSDLFLNWVYGSFTDEPDPGLDPGPFNTYRNFDPGTQRRIYMDRLMRDLAGYAMDAGG